MPDITRIGLVAKTRLDAAADVLAELAGWLEARGVQPVFEADTAALVNLPAGRATASRDEIPAACDLLVVLGGDGTFIGMAGRIAEAGVDVPILGVNFGSLGFLTEITLDELYDSLESVLAGTARIDQRMMLRSQTLRGGIVFTDRLALNDVVITKGALSRIIDLSVASGEQAAMRVRADGLIIASPTGSTAYNLAAGGPIVYPGLDAILLTPIAPHMLTNRPLVIPASADVRVSPAMDGHDEIFVTFDGQSGHALEPDDVISVRRAERRLRVVRANRRTYFDVLREKLKWNAR
ncbi:MAG: NAD(+)/NADH kinase [Acidobacteria bacterium]|nr:NAD(+)/NADH kinase [Acidobacteriota bacterium]MBA3886176.1 NAD(+)/NADH kinase [Acidobacteriota bacterium]